MKRDGKKAEEKRGRVRRSAKAHWLLALILAEKGDLPGRRVWLRIKPGHALLAMSSAKQTIDFEKEFTQHAQALDTLVK